MWIKLRYTLHGWSFCFSTRICWIHCIDQPKTFTLLLKSKSLDFKTLSHVHFCCIEYVSHRLGPYRIRIISADDRIVPALVVIIVFVCIILQYIHFVSKQLQYHVVHKFHSLVLILYNDVCIKMMWYQTNQIAYVKNNVFL